MRLREEVINTVLATCIANRGTPANPETIRRRGRDRPDVMATFRGLRCAFEGKVADVQNARAIVLGDAERRVEHGIAQIGIAIVYPVGIRTTDFAQLENALNEAELDFCLTTENGASEWRTGGIDDLLSEMRRVHEHLLSDDVVKQAADELSISLGEITDIFTEDGSVCERLASLLGMGEPEAETNRNPQLESRRRETAAKISALTLANAFIFQEQLAASETRVQTIGQVLDHEDIVSATERHWNYICSEINYVPIFRIAREILLNLPSGTTSNGAVTRLARQALALSTRRAALRHDLMGRIYHWLLHDAKFLGTYYTSVAAATLLLKLVFPSGDRSSIDWSDIEQIRQLSVADLACGTGTLLMAACQAITDNFIRASHLAGIHVDTVRLRELHRALMEDIILG